MQENIRVTHEMLINVRRFFTKRDFEKHKKDFEEITSVGKTALEKYIVVDGTIRVYGYKIEGEGYNNGFYDIFNRRLYTKKEIENAIITPYDRTFIQETSVLKRMLKR